jgi:hypothetical protein
MLMDDTQMEQMMAGIVASESLESGLSLEKISVFSRVFTEEILKATEIAMIRLMTEGFTMEEITQLMENFNGASAFESLTDLANELKE